MVRIESEVGLSEKNGHAFLLRMGEKTYTLTMDKALALAHSLLKSKHYKTARRICERVARWEGHRPEVAILLACCDAGLKNYAACNKLLHSVFCGASQPLAEHFQAALVYGNLGMKRDSARELIAVTDEDPGLAMAWLLLGDDLSDLGEREKAALCWRLAIDCDGPRGPASLAAQLELGRKRQRGHAARMRDDCLPNGTNR